jgi:hypothetical protein
LSNRKASDFNDIEDYYTDHEQYAASSLGLDIHIPYRNMLGNRTLCNVFPDRRDGHGQDVTKWYNRYRRKCGLNDLRNKDFHSFRHTFSTALFRVDVNPTIIAELDGHVAGGGKRRTTTEEVYIKSSEVVVLKEAVEKLDYGDVVDRLKVAEGW